MAFNTFPCNPYPISTEELNKGNNDDLNDRVATLEGDVSDLNSNKANQITIAPFFNAETAYTVGDLVYYNGLTYRCTNDHEGAWDADDFAATTISNELDTLKSGKTGIINQPTVVTFDEYGKGTFTVPTGYSPLIASLDSLWITTIHFENGQFYLIAHGTYDPTDFIKSATVTYNWFLYFSQ